MSFNLNQISALSVQEMVRDGTPHDLYYYDSSNLFVQSKPTLCDNKFIQGFTNPNSGVNQLIFSPNEGMTDVTITARLITYNSNTALANYSLNKGWLYWLINQTSVRYGGSSQYFFTGEQQLMQNVVDMQDAVSREFLYALGGDALTGTIWSANGTVSYSGYAYINLPHNTPNGDGMKMNPLPTELLRQPVLVQVELKPSASALSGLSGAADPVATFPTGIISSCSFQVKQVRMVNSSDLLTSHGDPSKIAYTLPLKYFPQQEYILSLPSGTTTSTVNLTGFRNGGVRSIITWLTASENVTATGKNWFYWYCPRNITLSINGEIFYTSVDKSSMLTDLVNNKQPNQLGISTLANTGSFVTGAATAEYSKCDFSQVNDAVYGVNMLVGGKSITNSIVNYKFDVPDSSKTWTLHALYLYNSSLVFSSGNCEYVF
jgi:hypothetical protein